MQTTLDPPAAEAAPAPKVEPRIAWTVIARVTGVKQSEWRQAVRAKRVNVDREGNADVDDVLTELARRRAVRLEQARLHRARADAELARAADLNDRMRRINDLLEKAGT